MPPRRLVSPAAIAARLCLLILLVAAVPDAAAQRATLRGFVLDADSREALPAVNVIAVDASGALEGTATDNDGFYTLAGLAPGTYTVRASYLGYDAAEVEVTLEGGELRQLHLELAPTQQTLGEVTVESERTSGAANVRAGVQSIRPADIRLVPAPDVSGDLVSYLTTLPGVVSTGDRGGQLFIRGGEPSQNEVLLDGIPLFQPFHLLGFYSAFPSDVLSRADVYAGGYNARYGGRLSSVIDVATRSGNKRRFLGAASVAPFVSAVQLEGPLARDRASVLASARVSVIDQAASKLVDEPLPFSFGDVFGKLHATPTPNSQLSVTGIYTWDKGTLGLDSGAGAVGGAAPSELRYGNLGLGGRYLFVPSAIPVLAEILVTFAQFESELGPEDVPDRSSSVTRFGGQAHITYALRRMDLRAGAFVRTTQLSSELGGAFQNVVGQTDYVTEAGLYVEPDVQLGFGLRVAPGLHLATSPNQNATFLEPRLRLVWNAGVHEISAAGGLYHQEIVGLSDRRDATSVFTAWTTAPFGEPSRAVHALAGYRITPTAWLDLALEGFYKRMSNLSVPEWSAFPRLTTRLQPATGEARGLDARAEIRRGPVYVALNYGYSAVEYEAEGRNLELWYGTETLAYRPPHDRRHQANALVSVDVFGFDVSARWQFGSGLPYSQAIGFDTFLLMDGDTDVLGDPGSPRVIYERPYNAELPTYHRLDISVERLFDLGAASVTAQAGLINAYDRSNLFYYDVFTLRRVDQLPLIPSFGLKVAFD